MVVSPLAMWFRFVCFALLIAGPAFSDEYAILKSGFRMSAQHIEKSDGSYRLTTSSGVIVVGEGDVVAIEKDDYVEPPPTPQPAGIEAQVSQSKPIPQMLDEAAARNGLPAAFVRSVARAESGMRPDAISPAGAIGVMQLMPATAAALHADPANPEQNIEAGTRYLRDLLLKYDGDAVKALAAYNAGPGAVDRYHGVPPYLETVTYVDRVIRDYKKSTR